MTIPRLELTAALLLVKLLAQTRSSLQLDVEATHLWTDSQVTLYWITSQAVRWKDYVRNRVVQIQDLCTDATWRHVPGVENPADCASRGVTSAQLIAHPLWWTGPQWLKLDPEHWPAQPELSPDPQSLELRPSFALQCSPIKAALAWELIERYSDLNRLLRVTALCIRFSQKLRTQKLDLPPAHLSKSDTDAALNYWIRSTQRLHFQDEVKTLSKGAPLNNSSSLSRLTAFLDEEGIIRVGGRLALSHLSYCEKHPAILPRCSPLTDLLIADAHKSTLHGGTQLTLSKLRQRVWIVGGRAPVKSHILRCVPCSRQRGITAQQLMAQLPLSRISPARAFLHLGVDYAGPVLVTIWKGRGSKAYKAWICVFVCFTTSAAHLELVTDCSSDGFLSAYRRFVSRRGIAHTIHSDCGTNFIGADAELKRLFAASSKENAQIRSLLLKDGTSWKFNSPASPHMGGKWEALVKSVKYHIRRTIGETLLTYEEFTTLLTQVEAVLNSRPLEPLSDDPEDVSALTPGHFLTGAALNTVPE